MRWSLVASQNSDHLAAGQQQQQLKASNSASEMQVYMASSENNLLEAGALLEELAKEKVRSTLERRA